MAIEKSLPILMVIIIVIINLLMQTFFKFLAKFERYDSMSE